MSKKRKKKSHGVRNFFLFVLVCTLLAVGTYQIVVQLFPFKYTEYIWETAEEFHIDPYLVLGVIKTESNFDENAVSKSNAMGLMQITASTARDCMKKSGKHFSMDALFEPKTNIYLGTYYLSYLLERFDGKTETALAAYNAGEGTVRKWLKDSAYSKDGKTLYSIPFSETKTYNQKIRLYRNIYEILDKWLQPNK